jgi:hypothetical protein
MGFGFAMIAGYSRIVEERKKHRDGCPYDVGTRNECENFIVEGRPCMDIKVCVQYKGMPVKQNVGDRK